MKTSYLKCCPAVRKLIYINFLIDIIRDKMSDIRYKTILLSGCESRSLYHFCKFVRGENKRKTVFRLNLTCRRLLTRQRLIHFERKNYKY
jgi:hypothetical protein